MNSSCLQMKLGMIMLDFMMHVKRILDWNTALYVLMWMLYSRDADKWAEIIKL